MALGSVGKRTIQNGVDNLISFHIGNVSGNRVETECRIVKIGELPKFLVSQLMATLRENDLYVVYSYKTPIAWCKMDERHKWFIPQVNYSMTTTNHQNVVSLAIHNEGFYKDVKW